MIKLLLFISATLAAAPVASVRPLYFNTLGHSAQVSSTGYLNVIGLVNSTGVSISNGLFVSGPVTATSFSGNGSGLTGVTASSADSASFLWRANNLSDLTNVPLARTNLGLGTMATQNSNAVSITGGDFSTSGSISAGFIQASILYSQFVSITGGNIQTSGNISAARIHGSTSVSGPHFGNGSNLIFPTGIASAGDITTSGYLSSTLGITTAGPISGSTTGYFLRLGVGAPSQSEYAITSNGGISQTGDSSFSGVLNFRGSPGSSYINLMNSGTLRAAGAEFLTAAQSAGNLTIGGNTAYKNIIFTTNGTEKARIDTNGAVGIGVSVPISTVLLQVNGSVLISDSTTALNVSGVISNTGGIQSTSQISSTLGLSTSGGNGIYSSGSTYGVYGNNNNSVGAALYADQLNQAGYGVYSNGGKNFFASTTMISTTQSTYTLNISGSLNISADTGANVGNIYMSDGSRIYAAGRSAMRFRPGLNQLIIPESATFAEMTIQSAGLARIDIGNNGGMLFGTAVQTAVIPVGANITYLFGGSTGSATINGGIGISSTKIALWNSESGTTHSSGNATLSGGTVVVSNSIVSSNTHIFLTAQTTSVNSGALGVSARISGTSFTVQSTNVLDANTFSYWFIEPF